MVVDALAGPILNMNLSHITGEAIVRGDTVAIRYEAITVLSGAVGFSFCKLLHGVKEANIYSTEPNGRSLSPMDILFVS